MCFGYDSDKEEDGNRGEKKTGNLVNWQKYEEIGKNKTSGNETKREDREVSK